MNDFADRLSGFLRDQGYGPFILLGQVEGAVIVTADPPLDVEEVCFLLTKYVEFLRSSPMEVVH